MLGAEKVDVSAQFSTSLYSLVLQAPSWEAAALGIFLFIKLLWGKDKHSQEKNNHAFYFASMDLTQRRDSP